MSASRGPCGVRAVLAAFVLASAGVTIAAATPSDSSRRESLSALLRVAYTEWSSGCPCPQDCTDEDSLFVRVHAGSSFMPRRRHYEWPEITRADPFVVVGVDDSGRVHVRLPASLGLVQVGRWGGHQGARRVTVGSAPVRVTTDALDGGLWFELSVIRSLPRSAVLGYPKGPRQPRRSAMRSPEVLEPRSPGDRVVALPAGYDGKVRAVHVRVKLDKAGVVSGVILDKPGESQLDSLATEAVRRWRFRPGLDCGGQPAPMMMEMTVHFAERR